MKNLSNQKKATKMLFEKLLFVVPGRVPEQVQGLVQEQVPELVPEQVRRQKQEFA